MENKELEVIMGFPRVFHVLMRKMMQDFEPSQENIRLNHTQRRTLLIIYNKKVMTMTELHRIIGLEKGSMTAVVDRLIRSGLVKRRRDEKDRRRVNISLSDSGRERVRILRMEIADHIRKNLQRLPAEYRERFHQTVEFLIEISRKL